MPFRPAATARRRIGVVLLILLAALSGYGWWHTIKPLPAGLCLQGEKHLIAAGKVRFLADLTSGGPNGRRLVEQQIFAALFDLIDRAEHYVLVDFFLFNDRRGREAGLETKPLAGLLVRHLIERKQQVPELRIDVITDPINSAYGGARATELNALRAAGINLVVTDLKPLRDSNPLYSLWWRLLLRRLPDTGRFFPHPFAADGERVSLSSWLNLINFKANHRKVAIADQDGELISLVTSANPHGASRNHSNIGLLIADRRIAADLYRSELAVAKLSGGRLHELPRTRPARRPDNDDSALVVHVVTEENIRTEICATLDRAAATDRVRLAMFYLADRAVVEALLAADRRGVTVELILDPNRDAFGYRKSGVPNRPVAAELVRKSAGRIKIRWYRTHGEQFHSKLLLLEQADGRASLVLGSANLTRRNIGNFNLETDISASGALSVPPLNRVADYFERLWSNRDRTYTLPYSAFAEPARLKYLQYRLQEALGLGTF